MMKRGCTSASYGCAGAEFCWKAEGLEGRYVYNIQRVIAVYIYTIYIYVHTHISSYIPNYIYQGLPREPLGLREVLPGAIVKPAFQWWQPLTGCAATLSQLSAAYRLWKIIIWVSLLLVPNATLPVSELNAPSRGP